jgi:NAD(P)-dependent dehydrogenase (short-subunit alcohol dehydrogenase family)
MDALDNHIDEQPGRRGIRQRGRRPSLRRVGDHGGGVRPDRLLDTAVAAFGRLDVLVRNAGIGPISPLEDLRVDEWDDMIDVNLRGVLHGIAAALPIFRRQEAGHLVMAASTAASRTVPGQAVYSATKTAVRTICEGLRQEAGDLRVTVASRPSSTPTSSTRSPTPRPAPRCWPAAMPWHWIPPRSRTPSRTPLSSRIRSTSTRSWYGPPRSDDGRAPR